MLDISFSTAQPTENQTSQDVKPGSGGLIKDAGSGLPVLVVRKPHMTTIMKKLPKIETVP